MKINLSDKLIAYLALVSGLSISAVAIYYSVAGLMAIFAAAMIPIMIMGVVLEVGKLAATVWLKQNWTRAPRFLKTYLLLAIMTLMLLTSMGIFGYLSKAHLDQAVPTGDVAAKVSLLDEKIKTERDNIETARAALKQMDAQVDARLSRSDDEKGAERAVQIRRQQQAERSRLQKDIAEAQAKIAKLNEERAPIASELRKVEAEVGPIKYIAALIYGDQTDQNLLEKAVRWVIIVIVLVFDPLAVILLLASQYSFNWFRQQEEENPQEQKQDKKEEEPPLPEPEDTGYVPGPWPFPVRENGEQFLKDERDIVEEANEKLAEIEREVDVDAALASIEDVKKEEEKSALEEWNKMIEEAERAVEQEKEEEDEEILSNAPHTMKEAMAKWKHENPNSSLKLQKKLYARGVIDHLPWEDYLKPQADFKDDAVEEAKKWAEENPQTEEAEKAKEWADEKGHYIGLDQSSEEPSPESKKKDSELDRDGGESSSQENPRGLVSGYIQNAEQNESTIWQRVKDAKKD